MKLRSKILICMTKTIKICPNQQTDLLAFLFTEDSVKIKKALELVSRPLGGSKVDSAFHPPEVDRMSTRNFWELSGKK